MAYFVGYDAQGGYRLTVGHLPGEAQHFLARVIMVAETPRGSLDGDVAQSAGSQEPTSGIKPAKPSHVAHPGIFGICGAHLVLGEEGQDEGRKGENKVHRVKIAREEHHQPPKSLFKTDVLFLSIPKVGV
jgi:hypothetical protein